MCQLLRMIYQPPVEKGQIEIKDKAKKMWQEVGCGSGSKMAIIIAIKILFSLLLQFLQTSYQSLLPHSQDPHLGRGGKGYYPSVSKGQGEDSALLLYGTPSPSSYPLVYLPSPEQDGRKVKRAELVSGGITQSHRALAHLGRCQEVPSWKSSPFSSEIPKLHSLRFYTTTFAGPLYYLYYSPNIFKPTYLF